MTKTIRVIQYGLGPIGSAVARLIAESSGEAAHDRLTAPATGT